MAETDASAPAVPIREISRLTGVNAVTLRAWERRYGLLKPQRTNKGHRLYSHSDVQRVRDIQIWLARGLAISQVRDVLARGEESSAPVEESWNQLLNQAQGALQQLNRRKLADWLHQLTALYPTPRLADHLVAPLLEQLQQQQAYGSAAELACLNSVALEHFYWSLAKQRQAAQGSSVLVIKADAVEGDLLPLMLTHGLLANDFRAEYLGYVPTDELVYAAQQSRAQTLVLYSDLAKRAELWLDCLTQLQQRLDSPVYLAGKLVPVCAAHAAADAQALLLDDNQQGIIAALLAKCPSGEPVA